MAFRCMLTTSIVTCMLHPLLYRYRYALLCVELLASPLASIREGDHLVAVNGRPTRYSYDVWAALKQAKRAGAKSAELTCAGIRTTSSISIVNSNPFRNQSVDQLKSVSKLAVSRHPDTGCMLVSSIFISGWAGEAQGIHSRFIRVGC